MKTKAKAKRKAIFVSESVFKQFREAAMKDNRKYSAFLEQLLVR